MNPIVLAIILLGGMGLLLGVLLAVAAHIFRVKTDPRIEEITSCLSGANCGGCGYAGCSSYAQAIVEKGEKTNLCRAGGEAAAEKIAGIMGVKAEKVQRMRAQVMCSGTSDCAKNKYVYEGAEDCAAAARLGGGNKLCPNGCIGLGSCVKACKFGAISVRDGIATVDYRKCVGCGTCTFACPKHIIRMIPYDSRHWVGCLSVDNGKTTASYCKVGCISCRLCEKNCAAGAITVNDFVARIDYDKCTECGVCVDKCPRHIIWSDKDHRMKIGEPEAAEVKA